LRPGRGGSNGFDEVGMPDTAQVRTMIAAPDPVSFDREFRRVTHACVHGRVVVHTFDIYNDNAEWKRRGDAQVGDGRSRTVAVYGDFEAEMQEGLIELAQASGGFFHSGATLKPMTGIVERSGFLYTLGYASAGGKPGEFRKIRVKCKRKGVELRYRAGYFGN